MLGYANQCTQNQGFDLLSHIVVRHFENFFVKYEPAQFRLRFWHEFYHRKPNTED